MRMIHISRAGAQLGTFSEEEVRAALASGRFTPADMAWAEGMTEWKPLSTFSEFSDVSATPVPAAITASQNAPMGDGARTGLPWENRESRGLLGAFSDTLVMVLTKPAEAFTIMRREGGLGQPLLYAVIGGSLGSIVSLLFTLGLQSLGMFAGQKSALSMMAGVGIGTVALIVFLPLIIAIGVFLSSAIIHVCLMIVGGANKSFETTFRVISFTHGSTGVVQMIPFCGGIIAGIWGLIVSCIGLARAQETTTGKAVLAVFLPLIVCCGGGCLLAMFFGVGAALMHSNQ